MARTTPTPKLPKSTPWNDQTEEDAGKPRQTIVPAGAAPAVKTSAANSVFSQAAPPKVKRESAPWFDPTKVAITRRPIPPAKNTREGSPYQKLLDGMKNGDSVDLPKRNALTMATHMRKQGVKVTVRDLGNDVFGVWRLS